MAEEISQEIKSRTQWHVPPNHGWLEYKLNKIELDYVWKCIDERPIDHCNNVLAGNIDSSFPLNDKDKWFFNNTLTPLISLYDDTFSNLAVNLPIKSLFRQLSEKDESQMVVRSSPYVDYTLSSWWVNYQKENEFNPIHGHTGVYSFVLWLKIPTEHAEQNHPSYGVTNAPEKSNFCFSYTNILGEVCTNSYKMGKRYEGTLLFFPSRLKHIVYPYYNCSEDRISVSGNIFVDI